MVKRRIAIFVCLILLTALPYPASAAPAKVIDRAGLLSAYEESQLESSAIALSDTYGIDVVILTVESTYGADVTEYADNYFDRNGYGIGSDHSGVLLMLSMEDRDWVITTSGKGIQALTDYGQEQIMDIVLEYLREDDYFHGFQAFHTELDTYFAAYERGEPIDYQPGVSDYIIRVLIALVIGALAGFITITVMKSGMKTAVFQHGARDYVVSGTYQIRAQRDIYLYSNLTRVRRSSDSSGTHRGSSGRSHGGSRGKF